MPLEWQNVEVPFGALDTYTDPTEIPIGALTVAENVSSQVDGRYSKRFGYERRAATPTTETAIALAKRGSELLLIDNFASWNYNSANDQWTGGVPIPHASTRQEYIALEQSKNFPLGTRATVGDISMHAWVDNSTRDLFVYLFSDPDHTAVAAYIDATADWDVIHVARVGDRLAVFYSSSASQLIKFCLADPATLTFGTVQTIKSAADVFAGTPSYAVAPFDIYTVSSTEVLMVWATDTPDIRILRHNVYTNTTVWTTTLAAEEPDGGIAICGTSGEFGVAMWHSATSTALRVRGFNPTTGAATFAATTVEATLLATGVNFNCGLVRVSASSILMVWDRRGPAPNKGRTSWATVSSGGSIGTQSDKFNVFLQTKPFTYGGYYYCNVFAPYDTQETYFTLLINNLFVFPVAMHSYRTAYSDGQPEGCLADIDAVSEGVYAFDSPIAYKFLSNSFANAGMASYFSDFTDPLRYRSVEMGQSVFFSSGVTFRYDGGNTLENNFLLYPEVISATAGAVGSAGMDNGQYSYIVVYESADSNGNVDRSTTSLPVTVTTSAGAGLGKVDLIIDHLTMTGHIYFLRKVVASIFRTEASGSTYYFVGSQVVDPTGGNFTYTDQANDSTIIDNRIIYTQGGILDREPAPPSKCLVVHNNRMWGVSSADPKMVFYSGDYVPGESPWFSTLQQFRIDPGGEITALASLDDRLLIFKEDRIFAVTGRGGSPSGTNSDLTPPRELTSDVGCIDPRSVVLVPQGVMFQSAKGIYLLSRGEELSFIGMPVDSYLTDMPTVTSAVLMPATAEVRFDIQNDGGDGLKLVYNYRDNRWTTHTNCDAYGDGTRVDSIILGDDYLTVDSSGILFRETPDEFLDPGPLAVGPQYIVMRLKTGWIKLAGKQGLVRCQRLLVLNEILEEHDLDVQIYKDYVDVAVQTASFAAADITALPQEQIAIHLQNQQGEAFMIEIADSESDIAETEGFNAKGLTFIAGVKRGSFEKVMQAGAKA